MIALDRFRSDWDNRSAAAGVRGIGPVGKGTGGGVCQRAFGKPKALMEEVLTVGYLYLIVHIAGTVSFGHIMKWALRRRCELAAVGAVNYAVASSMSLLFALILGSAGLSVSAIATGILGGLSYVVSFFFYAQAMRLTGVSISTAVVRLSMLPAVLASVLIWGERPGLIQVVGMVLVFASLPLLSQQPGDKTVPLRGEVWHWLLAVFVTTSGGYLAARLFQEVGSPAAKPLLLSVWFGVSALVGAFYLRVQRLAPRPADLPLGIVLGAANVIGNFALLAALESLPGAIVFPVSTAGGLVLTILTSAALWREKLSRPALAGVLMAVPALVLMNLPKA